MPDVVVAEFMDPVGIERMSQILDVVYDPDLVHRRDDLLKLLADARALVVRNLTRVDVELLDAAPRLQVVGRLGVGLDNIDTDVCAARGIAVETARGANTVAVAEWALGSMLVLARGVFGATRRVVDGEWPRRELVGRELFGRTLGLVGFGSIAREVANRALAFGMRVAASDPYLPASDPAWRDVIRLDLDVLLASSDVVSIHVPLLPQTRGLINARSIAHMRPGTILLNSSRGPIVDEEAVIEALRAGHLGGAALDVFATEPVTAESGARFRDVPNLVLTPHVAGITVESQRRVATMIADAVVTRLEGR